MIHGIADGLTAGLVSFVNTDTLEVEEIFKDIIVYPGDIDEEFEEGELDDEFNEWKTMEFKFHKWENYIEIHPIESFESFKIMEGFVYNLPESHLKNQLANALNRKKPFANFNHIIHNCELKQDWLDYQIAQLENHVYDLLREYLPD